MRVIKMKVNKKMKTNKHLRFIRGKYIEPKKTFPIKIKIIHLMKDYISQVIFAFVLLKIWMIRNYNSSALQTLNKQLSSGWQEMGLGNAQQQDNNKDIFSFLT